MLSCSLRQILTLPSECRSKNQDSSDQATFFQSSILVILCELYPACPVLIWQERHPVWSSAAGAHLLQGLTCCVFRDGILHTLVVTSGYLSYCCPSIIPTSLPILLWPLTATRHFRPHNCSSLDIFYFQDHSLYDSLIVCVNKISAVKINLR